MEQRAALRNGYRLLVGNNHFFRVNCPRDLPPTAAAADTMAAMSASMSASTTLDEASFYDYDRAWLEANADDSAAGGAANPISSAVDQYLEQIAIKHQVRDAPAPISPSKDAHVRGFYDF